jgi:hypothetical protein
VILKMNRYADKIPCENPKQYQGLIVNGFKWFGYMSGFHYFSKETDRSYAQIKCNTDQIHNGDLEYMTLHNLTMV